MKKILKKSIVLLMALTLLCGFTMPLKAEAALKKINAKTNWAKSPKLKTGKNYLVTANEYEDKLYYVQFTAPKKGTYEFTFKNLTKHGESTNDVISHGCAGFNAFQYDWDERPSSLKLKIGKEDVYTLYLCSRYSWSLNPDAEINAFTSVPERKVKIKMEKGATVYIDFNFTAKCDIELSLKKK